MAGPCGDLTAVVGDQMIPSGGAGRVGYVGWDRRTNLHRSYVHQTTRSHPERTVALEVVSGVSRSARFVITGIVLVTLGGGVTWAAANGSSPMPSAATTTGGSASAPDRQHGIWRHQLFGHLSSAELTVTIEGTEHHIRIDRGTVESVSSTEVVLKELDGSSVTISVNSHTRVLVDGQEASITDLKSGYVGLAIRDGNNPARALRAHDPSRWPGGSLGADSSADGP
jgi:hypothetical protein